MKDVTIVIPSYVTDEQSTTWLYECVASALRQDCQVVVYDDCSKLDVDQLKSNFGNVENLRVFKCTAHKGVSYARNRAVEQAKTSLILPLDCDDLLVDGAVDKLLQLWQGVPVYPDLSKFGLQEVPHYRLLDFSCKIMQEKLGASSVTVLHAVEQWKSVGGWDEHLDLYEDAEYNSRLMLMYCGMNLHEPLLRYRQHESQRTRKIQDTNISVAISRDILSGLRRLQVGCPACGGKRRSSVEAMATRQTVAVTNVNNLPGTQDGRILALYIGGKGQAAHYYKGVNTHFAYKVIYNNYYYVDPSDATSPATPGRRSLFVTVDKPVEIAKVEEQKLEEVVTRTAVQTVVRTPVEEKIPEESLPDIYNMNVGDVREIILTSLTQAKKLLEIEKAGRNRSGVIYFFEKFIKSEV
ncbi:MAG: glycosyltransferase family 2 protein [Candidatus Izemoplasmatales bacterium]